MNTKGTLMSVLMIGVVAIAAGAGTMAYFSDTETSTGNTFTAGTLDLYDNNAFLQGGEGIQKAGTEENDEIVLHYSFEKPVIESGLQDYKRILIPGLKNYGAPGAPIVPFKTAKILIPYGKEVQDIKVIPGEKVYLGKLLIEPGQKPFPIGKEGEITPPNKTIYNSMHSYPENIYSKVGVQWKKGYQVLILNLYPIQYIPKSRDVSYFKSITVAIKTKPALPNALFRGLPGDREDILRIVDNPKEVNTYDKVATKLTTNPVYEYVIITNDALKNAAVTPNFSDLIDWKKSKGLNGTIVTTEQIYSTYTVGDNQTKIRDFIRYAYLTWGTEYILLGGDADGGDVGGESGDNIVPVRKLWSFEEEEIAADLYYACLDGSYDYDGDGVYGEPKDGPDGGEVDLMAEVYVGRAPIDSPVELSNFVNKTISYESTLLSDQYLKDTWMVGELLWENGGGCTIEEAVYKGNVSKPEEKLNSIRELRDKYLKDKYITLYYDYSPEIKEILIEEPKLLVDAAGLIVKYIPAIRYVIGDERGEDLKIEEKDLKEFISFMESLKNEVMEREGEIGAERSRDIIKSIEEFEEQANASKGKTFSQALKSSIYFEMNKSSANKFRLQETWGGDYKDEINNGSCAHGYCTVGFPDTYNKSTLYDRDYPGHDWPKSEIISIINNNTHLINHIGHANVGYVMKMYNSDVDTLTNNKYFFGYSQGCYAGSFDNEDSHGSTTDYDCIIEHFITNPTGAFGFIANSRYGWGKKRSTDGPSQHFDRQFWDAIFGEGITNVGKANQDSKEDNIGSVSDRYMRYCYYGINLLGDPETSLFILRPGHDIQVATLDAPTYTASGIPITVNATIKNRGSEDESNIEIQLLENNTIKDNKTIGSLPSGSSTTVSFSWSSDEPGTYTLGIYAVPVSGETSIENNYKEKTIRVVQTFTVDDDGRQDPNANYTDIQEAIDNANDGDTIKVYPGSYSRIIVDKPINLIGIAGSSLPVIDGGGSGDVVVIQADNVLLKGFRVINSGDNNTGIKIEGDNNLIEGNEIYSNDVGIGLNASSNNIISGNSIESNNYGIAYDRASSSNNIFNNNITSNNNGIYIRDSGESGIGLPCNNIYHNNFKNNAQNAKDEVGEDDKNSWYNFDLREGNYWSDYLGEDNNGDGIGDTPYNIPGGANKDLYPFMKESGWSSYEIVVSIPNTSANPGETVTVPIRITNVTDLGAANIWLHYNGSKVVNVTAVSDGDLGPITYRIDNVTGVTKMNWFSATGKTGDFVFAYVTLHAVGNMGETSPLDLDVKELVDTSNKPIRHTAADGTFTVGEGLQLMEGDVDMDMHVEIADAMLIAQYKADLISLNASQLKCADTTDDGIVSMADAMHIAQWKAGIPYKPLWESPADDDMLKPVDT